MALMLPPPLIDFKRTQVRHLQTNSFALPQSICAQIFDSAGCQLQHADGPSDIQDRFVQILRDSEARGKIKVVILVIPCSSLAASGASLLVLPYTDTLFPIDVSETFATGRRETAALVETRLNLREDQDSTLLARRGGQTAPDRYDTSSMDASVAPRFLESAMGRPLSLGERLISKPVA